MNANDVRKLIATTAKSLLPAVWEVTLVTWPELPSTWTLQVGHAAPTYDTYKSRRIEVPVALWANEGNAAVKAQDALYAEVSWEPTSLVAKLVELDWVAGVVVDAVGPRIEGPTGFLVADLIVTARLREGST